MGSSTYDATWVWNYVAPGNFAYELTCKRLQRLELIWRIATKTWDDYLIKPGRCDEALWAAVSRRFTSTDLQTPVLTTFASASYGGRVTRRIHSAVNKEELERVLKECNYAAFVAERWNPEALLYGTSYGAIGWRHGKYHLTQLSPIATEIRTPEDDVEDILAIVSHFSNSQRSYERNGIYRADSHGGNRSYIEDTNFGYLPVAIARGKHLDASSPYGDDLVWPATQESVQCTYLNNDIMFLVRLQSFSTLVIKGTELTNAQGKGGHGPSAAIRLAGGPENDAYFISPQAAINQLSALIGDKYERTATQCQVSVETFTRAKSGTNQSAGSSYLSHKPTYDVTLGIQRCRARDEHDFIARIDASLSWLKNGKKPVDLQKHKDALKLEVLHERETNPSWNQSDAQTAESLLSSYLVTHEKVYWKFNPDGTEEEQKQLEKLREESRMVQIESSAGDGFGPESSSGNSNPARVLEMAGK